VQIGLILLGIAALAVGLVLNRYFSLWLRAYVTQTRISLPALVLMSLRRVSPQTIVDSKVMAVQAGLAEHATRDMEAHYLAGGNVPRVTRALIAAHRADIPLNWNTAAAIDLAGRDILEAVQTSVSPKVIDCPISVQGTQSTIDAVSKDGIQLNVRVRVTVRTNLLQLIGGATEATVVARVGQGIVTAIGSCDTYRMALANPMVIAEEVLKRGLDSQTAFAIVSIDIAEITVGDNIGARLQLEQAQADMRMAQAEAEKRRAMAVASEGEMRALVRENQAAVVLAEAEIPKAMAEAYREGWLSYQPGHPRSGVKLGKPSSVWAAGSDIAFQLSSPPISIGTRYR
jgi:uncharacterized protein YqfA (UPF0365 family)